MQESIYKINTEKIHKNFGDLHALKDINLNFSPGYMHGLIGPDGAGKTTLMRIMMGLLKPTSGQCVFSTENGPVNIEEIRDDVAYMPQQQSLYADLSIGEHLEFFRDLYGIDNQIYQKKRKQLLYITGLENFTDRPAGKLSGGMYKKLGLICALLRSPRIILLDEPTNGVDPISRREFWNLLYSLLDNQILIIITTAYMDEAERCGYVHLMENGNVIGDGKPQHVLRDANVKNFDEFFMKRGLHDFG